MAWGQAAAPGAPQAAPPAPTAAPEPDVPADSTVITIEGVCEHPSSDKPADCKTTVTKAEFEEAIKAIQPTIPPAAQRRQFANRYAMLMIFSDAAHKQGIDKGPKFEEQMKLTRMEVASRLLGQSMQEKAGTVSDTEITDFYTQHAANFEQVDVQQIFVPHAKQPTPPAKSGATPAAKPTPITEEATRTEVEGLYKRAAAGEDFSKLQTEAYTFAGLKTRPPDTKVKGLKRGTLTPNRAVVFELKPGEVSKVVTDPTGYFIYKLDKKDTVPMATVRADIENAIKSQKMQAAMKTMEGAATPKFDDKYFGPLPGPGPAGMPGAATGPVQPPMRPAPTPAQPPNNK
ncbi:MAG TPA: peptidyl-prolyl cis-trans isomerase [Terriglobales bacterium]|nr:peptidyl-prolyl cis-trans isomerase [Terriglobales bacterium]